MEIDFGGCLTAIFVGILSWAFKFLMRFWVRRLRIVRLRLRLMILRFRLLRLRIFRFRLLRLRLLRLKGKDKIKLLIW
jgi:hypothetical protein